VYKAARDFVTADVDKVLIDNEEEYNKVRNFLQLLGPQYIGRLEYYNSGRSLFDDFKIEEELQKLMRPKINLPSGASIVIESTEALTVVDVNSGKFTGGRNLEDTILKTNVEAAEEIARQVRLRDIGGIIVVDFIDMASEASRDKVVKTMEESLRRDRTRATIQSFSNLGLLEFTRKRIGKDLGGQLRGSCPTCAGMGSVMSAQSVAIETFRQIRAQAGNGLAGEVVVHVAPTVAVQMEYWYESECEELARDIGHPIHVRVDPMIHPEKARLEVVSPAKRREHAVRVGDEHDVELLPVRLPSPTSAAAVIDGRVAEVENAANNAGNFGRIRIIDVDDATDYVLAELVTAGAKPRRKRRGRRAEVSAAEQTRQLRELAEDAARQSAARPPIGISAATEEEEALDKALTAERRGEAQPDAIIISQGAVQHAATDGRRKRRRRRRGRRDEGAAAVEMQVQSATSEAAVSADGLPADDAGQHRRRRRRRRGRRGRGGAGTAPMPDRHIFEVGADGSAHPTGATAPPEPSRAIVTRSEAGPPAVEAPPPSLTAPADETKRTKPARRRRTKAADVSGELAASASALALPSPEKTTRRPRKKTETAAKSSEPPAIASEAKPKATRKRKAATTASRRKATTR
ncbi:MAG TPA: ribonuclease E/G, partial [Candidatus Nitrosotalea sp.]|nr:ribonuclease E/G [Candidatus Nitrosotalea sp.]